MHTVAKMYRQFEQFAQQVRETWGGHRRVFVQ